jgi:hypothetical protein
MSDIEIHVPGDLSRADYARLVQVVADANQAADLKDKQLQHIETTLDTALLAAEQREDAEQLDPDSGLPNWLHAQIQSALGGPSNDDEHDALAAVAAHFNVDYISYEDREDTD